MIGCLEGQRVSFHFRNFLSSNLLIFQPSNRQVLSQPRTFSCSVAQAAQDYQTCCFWLSSCRDRQRWPARGPCVEGIRKELFLRDMPESGLCKGVLPLPGKQRIFLWQREAYQVL